MDFEEKMKLCFNDELIENKILTENEKKVLASLMYSYMICKESKNNTIIRSMDALREDIQISTNDMYDAIRNLESLYHMIERTAGESRAKGKPSIASQFKLNFDAINNPPKERMKFDFSKKIKPSETSINTIVIDTVTDIDTNIVKDTNIDRDTIINEGTNTIIDKEIVSDIDEKRKIDIDCDVEDNQVNDVVFENETKTTSGVIERTIGEYQIDELIKGFSKAKDVDAIIEHFQKVANRLSHLRNEKRNEYVDRIGSALDQRCKELGIDTNVIQKYFI